MPKSILEFLFHKWYFFLPLTLVIVFISYRSFSKNTPKLSFIAPTVGDIEEQIEVSGTVDAGRTAILRFLGGGKLTYLSVREGDEVKKNQKIASIDVRDLQKSLTQALNLTNVGRNNLDQGRFDVQDTGLTPTAVRKLASLQSMLNNNVLDVELRDLAIQNSSLYAPFEGVVTKLPTNAIGMQVLVTDQFEITDPASLIFSGEVDEVDIGRVKVGQLVHLSFEAYPEEVIDATVASIAMKASPSTKASGGTVFIVKALLPPEVFHYKLGMNGTMKIVTRKATKVLAVPLADVTDQNGKKFVQIKVGDNKAEPREVQTGIESNDSVEILSGLTQNDQIVEVK